MQRNLFWLLLLIGYVSVTMVFTSSAAMKVYRYSRLNGQAQVALYEPQVVEVARDKYLLTFRYAFIISGIQHSDFGPASSQVFRNRAAAEGAIHYVKRDLHTVYYAKGNPAVHQLYREFPYRACIYAGLLLACMAYLIGVALYVKEHPINSDARIS